MGVHRAPRMLCEESLRIHRELGDRWGRVSALSSLGLENPTTHVAAQLRLSESRSDGDYLVFRHQFPHVRKSFYVRARGTNTDVAEPRMDPPGVNPWDDLWFYSNPVFIELPSR